MRRRIGIAQARGRGRVAWRGVPWRAGTRVCAASIPAGSLRMRGRSGKLHARLTLASRATDTVPVVLPGCSGWARTCRAAREVARPPAVGRAAIRPCRSASATYGQQTRGQAFATGSLSKVRGRKPSSGTSARLSVDRACPAPVARADIVADTRMQPGIGLQLQPRGYAVPVAGSVSPGVHQCAAWSSTGACERAGVVDIARAHAAFAQRLVDQRSEEHTSELQSR